MKAIEIKSPKDLLEALGDAMKGAMKKTKKKLIATVKIKKEWKELYDLRNVEIEKANDLVDELAEQKQTIDVMSNEMWGKIRRESGYMTADHLTYNEKDGVIEVYEDEEEECDGDCENCDKN